MYSFPKDPWKTTKLRSTAILTAVNLWLRKSLLMPEHCTMYTQSTSTAYVLKPKLSIYARILHYLVFYSQFRGTWPRLHGACRCSLQAARVVTAAWRSNAGPHVTSWLLGIFRVVGHFGGAKQMPLRIHRRQVFHHRLLCRCSCADRIPLCLNKVIDVVKDHDKFRGHDPVRACEQRAGAHQAPYTRGTTG